MSSELISIMRSFKIYEVTTLTQIKDCETAMRSLTLNKHNQEEFQLKQQQIAKLRENLRDAKVHLAKILCQELRQLIDDISITHKSN